MSISATEPKQRRTEVLSVAQVTCTKKLRPGQRVEVETPEGLFADFWRRDDYAIVRFPFQVTLWCLDYVVVKAFWE